MIINSSKKLLMASPGSDYIDDPYLVWTLGDRLDFGGSTISLPGTLLENDVVFVATAADTPGDQTVPTGGYTTIAVGSANTVGYMLAYKVMGATPDTSITGLASDTNATHTAFAFRNLGTYDADWQNTGASGTPTPNATPAAGVSSPTNGIILFIGYLDDDLFLMNPPSPFIKCGRSTSDTKGACIAASYAKIPVGSFGSYSTGGNDSWYSVVTTFNPA